MLILPTDSNLRPISNLKTVSKVIEKIVAVQLSAYISTHHLDEWFQSAYKLYHSTETALSECRMTFFMPLTITIKWSFGGFRYCRSSYSISRLSDRFGFFAWFESYLKSRKYYVQVERSKSTTRTLTCRLTWFCPCVIGWFWPTLYFLCETSTWHLDSCPPRRHVVWRDSVGVESSR